MTVKLSRKLKEVLLLTDLKDVTVTSAQQFDHLEVDSSLEWKNVTDFKMKPGSKLIFDGG